MLRVQVSLNTTSMVTNHSSLPKITLVLRLKVPWIRKLHSLRKIQPSAAQFSWLHLQFSDYPLQLDLPKAPIYLSFLGPKPGASPVCLPTTKHGFQSLKGILLKILFFENRRQHTFRLSQEHTSHRPPKRSHHEPESFSVYKITLVSGLMGWKHLPGTWFPIKFN